MVLGGHKLSGGEPAFRGMFARFWDRFRKGRPDLDLYSQPFDRSLCVPIALHGDEGRGKLKRPIMVLSLQPVISWRGEAFTNSSRYVGETLANMFML